MGPPAESPRSRLGTPRDGIQVGRRQRNSREGIPPLRLYNDRHLAAELALDHLHLAAPGRQIRGPGHAVLLQLSPYPLYH